MKGLLSDQKGQGFEQDIEAEGDSVILVVVKPGGNDYWAFVSAKNLNKLRVC